MRNQGRRSAGRGEVDRSVAFHGVDHRRVARALADHAAQAAVGDQARRIGVHPAAGGRTGAADRAARHGGAGADEIDRLIPQSAGEFLPFVEQGDEPFVRLVAPGPDHAGEQDAVSRLQAPRRCFIDRSGQFDRVHKLTSAWRAAWQLRLIATGRLAM
ncbi:hypothetical protein SDC9_171766 [bioreactor metagenome]|uniref:Uncharacterized protein n=1 Tax=bioreactor metagenome TaxID=1076179 RepID=A0A645GBR8_9ZZZZ